MTNSRPPRHRSLCLVRTPSAQAFSLVETLITVGLIALILAVVIPRFGNVKTGVERAKLDSDVAVLNEAVGLYVAEGGNLDNATNPQEVIERLKTRSRDADARRHVGPVTGRVVDPRLTARILTASEARSAAPRAIWSPTLKKFVIATRGSGVAAFYFDDAKAGLPTEQESRKPSSVQYNGGDGWIWDWQEQSEPAPAAPAQFALFSPSESHGPDPGSSGGNPGGFDPGTSPPVVETPPVPTRLPTPTILPLGGAFSVARFPSSIQIGDGGAASGVSVLKYRLDSGPWQPYITSFSVPSGTQVFAKNFTLDPDRYLDSDEDTEIYLKIVDTFAGIVVPEWTDMQGGPNLVKTINNQSADDVKATYGKPTVSGASPNTLNFKRTSSFLVPPDTDFKIGVVSYYNGTVSSGTEASAIDLTLKLGLTKPALKNGSANVHLSLWSSPNTANAKESADYAQLDNPTTDFALEVDGVTYTLQLRFANVSVVEGWTDGTKLFVYEGSRGHADLIARFVSSY